MTSNFKADHVDAFDLDCDDETTTIAIFMANIYPAGSINGDTIGPTYDSDILFEVPHYDTYHDNDVLNLVVQETEYTEQLNDVAQYVPHPEQDNAMIFFVIEQMKCQVEQCNTLSTEQVYWSPVSKPIPSVSVVKSIPTKVFPKQLPTTSKVKDNLQKAKDHLDKFDACIKKRIVLSGVEISQNAKLRAQLQEKFSEPQVNQKGISMNTKFLKPSTSGNKLYLVTPFSKTQFIPKIVEKNDLSKIVTSHLNTNKVIEKCTKVLAPETLQELLEQARALKPSDENLDYAYKFAKRIQELLVRVSYTNASGSQPKSNTKNDRIQRPSSRSQKNKVEAQLRKFKSSSYKNNLVSDCNANVKNVALSLNSKNICLSCNECLLSANHEACVVNYLNDVQKRHRWIPTGRTFNLVGNQCALTRITPAIVVGNILISRVYYVEGLSHNLFSVRQLYDSDLEVAFRKHTCFVCNLDGVDLLSGSCGSNLHTISLKDMMNLQKEDLVKGSPKLKYTKDHLCSACQMGKSKKESHKPKPEPSTKEKLQMLHMDLCGPITKDETPDVIIKILKQAQPTNDSEDHGKLKPKADIGIFISYSPSRKAYRIYNKRAQMIMETIHVQFDELTQMASEQFSSGPELQPLTSGHIMRGDGIAGFKRHRRDLSSDEIPIEDQPYVQQAFTTIALSLGLPLLIPIRRGSGGSISRNGPREVVEIRLRAALPLPSLTSPPTHHPLSLPAPSTSRRADISEAVIAACRCCQTAWFGAARTTDYGFVDMEGAPTTLKGSCRVTRLAETHERDTQDLYAHLEDAHDSRARLAGRVDILLEDRQFHQQTIMLMEDEALIQDLHISSQETLTATLVAQVSSLQSQLIATLGQIQALQVRDPAHVDDPEDADSSS
ncbi:hypothetical protein Tco_0537756 [Tanacetum coccineum]